MPSLCDVEVSSDRVVDLIMACLGKMELYYFDGIPDLGVKVFHSGNMTVFYDAKEKTVKLYVVNGGRERVFVIPCECIMKKLEKK